MCGKRAEGYHPSRAVQLLYHEAGRRAAIITDNNNSDMTPARWSYRQQQQGSLVGAGCFLLGERTERMMTAIKSGTYEPASFKWGLATESCVSAFALRCVMSPSTHGL